MLYEKRQLKAEGYGNQEDALADLELTIPNSRVINVKRLVSLSGGDPEFIIDVEVKLFPQKVKLTKEKSDD